MMRTFLVLSLMLFAVTSGCVDNEQSFYIEHMKVQPDPPECSVSPGDESDPVLNVNLMLADAPGSYFQATNAFISREDYGNLKAESNGIFVEGYELYTTVPGIGMVGGTEYFEYNQYLGPETTDIIHATVLTSAIAGALRNRFRCEYQSPQAVADAIYSIYLREALVSQGETVSGRVASDAAAGSTLLQNLVYHEPIPEIMYSNVRFLGHSQGGKEVETPEFTVVINPTCDVEGGWEPCIGNVCNAFCKDDAAYPETCYSGVDVQLTCSDYLAGSSYTIPVTQLNAVTNENETVLQDICDFFACP